MANPLVLEVCGQDATDVEEKFQRWMQAMAGRVTVVKKHPVKLMSGARGQSRSAFDKLVGVDTRSMLVNYEMKPPKTKSRPRKK